MVKLTPAKKTINSFVLVLFLMLTGCDQKHGLKDLSEPVLRKPEWIKEGIVAGGSNHEPFIFYLRRGRIAHKTEENYLYTHSDEYIDRIKKQGATFYMTHAFKGFGLEAEKADIELAKDFASRLHAKGLKVGTYIGSSIAYETFLLEAPEAEEWLVPDYLGHPVYYHDQFFRRRPYFGHPGYRKYIKNVIRLAINEIGSDLIHFDNPANQAIPAVFHHPMAIEDFRLYLKKKYNPEMLKQRIGFSDVSRILPPAYPNAENFQSFDDPVTQEWIDFRCQKLADYYKEMSEYIRSLNPEVAVEINPHGITGENRAWESSVDFQRLLSHTDIFVCEDGNPASVTEDSILISNIRSYKLGKTLQNVIFNGVGSALAAAETMTYNPYSIHRPDESLHRYVSFYHNNFEHYANTDNIADVAILRSFPSMAYSNYNTHQSTILFEQVLIQCKIPFDIICDKNLPDLFKYSVLILANQECLSNAQLELIKEFVLQGGGLVATENSSLYDEWRRERESFGLKDLFSLDRPKAQNLNLHDEKAPELISGMTLHLNPNTIQNQYGKGKVVYIPFIEPSKKRPVTAPMRNNFWKLPSNYRDLADAVKWASGTEMSIEIKAPLTVTMELTRQENKMMVHLINYNVEKEAEVKNIVVNVKIPVGKQIQKVILLSPDIDESTLLTFTEFNGRAVFTVPSLNIYDLIILSLI
jgi:hypothetical protein